MRIVDLSQEIREGMPMFPGIASPRIETPFTLAENGFCESRLTFYSHTGTHVDAPVHIIAEGKTLDLFPVEHFIGRGLVIDVADSAQGVITASIIQSFADRIRQSEIVLLRTGWSRFWGEKAYFSGYPVLSPEAAELLASFPLKSIGLDALSADSPDAEVYLVHKFLLSKNILIVENLRGLEQLPEAGFIFCYLPLAVQGADGSPVRALALFPA